MNQPYLATARQFLADRAAPEGLVREEELSTGKVTGGGGSRRSTPDLVRDGDDASKDPIPFAAYRTNGAVRRCRLCAHVLSVVAVRDVCGRCALRAEGEIGGTEPSAAEPVADPTGEPARRGQALVALDRPHYPRLHLADGRIVGPGLEAWSPVLREMNAGELLELVRLVERTATPVATPEDEP